MGGDESTGRPEDHHIWETMRFFDPNWEDHEMRKRLTERAKASVQDKGGGGGPAT